MKQICEIVQDLLLLYEEGECSPGTAQYVEDHLAECEDCRSYRESLHVTEDLVAAEPKHQEEEKVIKKSFRKIRNRWVASLVAILMIFPISGVAILGVHEAKGEGICFTNLQEISRATKFVKLLEQENFVKAADMLDFSEWYEDIHRAEKEMGTSYYDEAILVNLGGETWAAKPEFAEDNHISEDGTYVVTYEERDFWMNILYNQRDEVWVPEEIWDKMVDGYRREEEWKVGEVFVPETILGEEMNYEVHYCYLETQWGNFYADSSYSRLRQQDGIRAADIVYASELIPLEIYEAAKEEVEADTKQQIEDFYEMYAETLAMTEEEYIAAEKEEFAKRLTTYKENGWSLTYRGFGDAFRGENHWQIELKVKENGGKTQNARIMLMVEGNTISAYVGSVGELYMTDEILGLVDFEEYLARY